MNKLIGFLVLLLCVSCVTGSDRGGSALLELPDKKGIMQIGKVSGGEFHSLNGVLKIRLEADISESEALFLRTVGLDPRIVVRCGLRRKGQFLGGFFSRLSFSARTNNLLISPDFRLSFRGREADVRSANGQRVLLSCTCEDSDGFEAKVAETVSIVVED